MADISKMIIELVELYGRDHFPDYILKRYDELILVNDD